MALTTDKLPNKALTGAEVLEIAVQEFRDRLSKQYAFQRGIAYRRVAFTLSATFHFGSPHLPLVVTSAVKPQGLVEGEAPLIPMRTCVCGWFGMESATVANECPDCGKQTEPEATETVALERDAVLENPNLERIHHDLPISMDERVTTPVVHMPALPGEPQVAETREIATRKLNYDKTQFAPPAPRVDRDNSLAKAQDFRSKASGAMKERGK